MQSVLSWPLNRYPAELRCVHELRLSNSRLSECIHTTMSFNSRPRSEMRFFGAWFFYCGRGDSVFFGGGECEVQALAGIRAMFRESETIDMMKRNDSVPASEQETPSPPSRSVFGVN